MTDTKHKTITTAQPAPRQRPGPAIAEIIKRAAKAVGATLVLEPEWQSVGRIIYPNGASRFFRLATLDLNSAGAAETARDKGYTSFFLGDSERGLGYPVPKGKTFLTQDRADELGKPDAGGIEQACAYAQAIGFPVFVKPNSLSRGVGVSKARTPEEFRKAAAIAMQHEDLFRVEKAVTGRDYRMVVLDGKVMAAYERIPLSVTGDGVCSVHELLRQKQEKFATDGRPGAIDPDDDRLRANLRDLGFTMQTVPPAGATVRLLDNANLSSGGSSTDVTGTVHAGFRVLAARIAHDMNLRLFGMDVISQSDLTQAPQDGKWWIIELNDSPGLNHFAAMGPRQRQIVEDIYREALIAMVKHPPPPTRQARPAPSLEPVL